jgi:small-conductance mechanosensitive channel
MSNTTAPTTTTPAGRRITSDDVQAHAQWLINDSWVWLQANWLQILIAAGIGTAIVLSLLALRRIGMKLCDRPTWVNGWGVIVGRAVARTSTFFIVMVAARLVVGYAGAPPVVQSTIMFLFTIAAVFQAAIWARELILGGVEHRTQGSEHAALGTAMGLIRLLVSFAVFAIALVVVLDNLGVNVTGLVAGLGVGGIAIGLAAQGIFADLFAALAIIFDRPFRVGDVISYDQTTGKVEAIGLKSTRLRPATGELHIIANKQLLDKEVINVTQRETRRVSFMLGLAYWTPVDVIRRVPDMLKEIVEAKGYHFAQAGFVNFGASSLDVQLEFDTPGDWAAFYAARHEVGLAVMERLNNEGIDVAYPTQTTFTAAPDGTMVMPYPDHLGIEPLAPARNAPRAG